MSESKHPLVDPLTGKARPQQVQPGYYGKWNVMREYHYWDTATRRVVEERLQPPKPLHFFTPGEAATLTAVFDRVLPQDDRLPSQRIPLLPTLDRRLAENKTEGYRYEDMPSDQEAYRLASQAFEAMAQEVYKSAFGSLTVTSQELLLESLAEDKPAGARELWSRMNVKRLWTLLLSDTCSAYYAHPWAWNEIGFGGPAYPRGYMRLENGLTEPWEFGEERYEWSAPVDSISDKVSTPSKDDESYHGQAGTH